MTDKLKKYEGMFLLNNSRLTEQGGTGVSLVSGLLEKHGAKTDRIDVWDERRLAYPVKKQKRGTYILSHFEAPGDSIAAMQREINISDDVMRVLFIRHEKDFPEFKTAAEMEASRPRRDERGRGGDEDEDLGVAPKPRAKAAEAAPAPEAAPEAPAADATPEAPEAPAADASDDATPESKES